MDSSSLSLEEQLANWKQWNEDPEYNRQYEEAIAKCTEEQLRNMFCEKLSFGTAGLRCAMGPGFNRINTLTIIQTTQGLAMYLMKNVPTLHTDGVLVGYDGRRDSLKFARHVAAVFYHIDVPVIFFSNVVPTPYVAFGVRLTKCAAGIMITASHNPKDDNGYKLYLGNGCQISSPADKEIAKSILEQYQPWQGVWEDARRIDLCECQDPLDRVQRSFEKYASKYCRFPNENKERKLRAVYSAMHGVGTDYVRGAVSSFNLNPLVEVAQQADPDPEFSTVKFPNPEETSALRLAMGLAEEKGISLVLANDPDADRFCMAERSKLDGTWTCLSGNDIGTLFAWWLLEFYCKQIEIPLQKVYMLSSTVSSKILQTIAKIEGFNFEETLTGFKWLGNRAYELQNQGNMAIFCFEEAIGFKIGDGVYDKDGVTAAAVAYEMASYLDSNGSSVCERLRQLYQKYGLHLSYNSYYICYQLDVIKRVFQEIRHTLGDYHLSLQSSRTCNIEIPFLLGRYEVTRIRDLTTPGFDSSQSSNHFHPTLPISSSNEMITLYLSNGIELTIRTSGTEPKIKFYSSYIANDFTKLKCSYDDYKQENENFLASVVTELVESLLKPAQNQLINRPL